MKCMKCGKEINKIVPDFDLDNKTGKINMSFICEECDNKRYEELKEIFSNGESRD